MLKRCSGCKTDKPYDEFYTDSAHSSGYSRYCKVCEAVRSKRWRMANRETVRVSQRDAARRKLYSLEPQDYLDLMTLQQEQCAICGATTSGHGRTSALLVDHDHQTGKVRGLLCHGCNGGLGHFKDDPNRLRAAIEYLEARS